MGIIGSALGGALGIGAGIFGGIAASKAMGKVKDDLGQRQRENQNWFNRRFNEDATQRADAQRILAIQNDNIRQRNRQAAGTAAVMGGTPESMAAAKAANAQAMAEATSQIAAAGDRRKEQVESQYLATKADLNDRLNDLEKARAGAISQAVQGVGQAGAGIASAF